MVVFYKLNLIENITIITEITESSLNPHISHTKNSNSNW